MTEEIASRAKVEAACAQLRAKGIKPTAGSVRELLKGGSKSTILRHMADMRAEEAGVKPAAGAPDHVLVIARPLIDEVYAAAMTIADANYADATSRYHRNMEEMEAQLQEAVDSEVRVSAELQSKIEELEKLRVFADSLQQVIRDQRDQIDRHKAAPDGNSAEAEQVIRRLAALLPQLQGNEAPKKRAYNRRPRRQPGEPEASPTA